MATKTLRARMAQRIDTTQGWEQTNPVLAAGELGVDSTTRTLKVGDGVTPWKSLPTVNATTPDWDANEWSKGHIKNRTHRLEDVTVLEKDGDTYDGILETQYFKWQDDLFPISRGESVIIPGAAGATLTYGDNKITLHDPNGYIEAKGGLQVAIGVVQIPEAYIPDSIARHFYIEELYEEVTALWGLTEWPTIDGTALMNSLDRGLTLDELMAMGFPAKIREYPHEIKGILIESPTSEGYRKQRLPLMYASENEHGVDCVSFGHISRAAYGSELDISFENDGTCYITYTEG